MIKLLLILLMILGHIDCFCQNMPIKTTVDTIKYYNRFSCMNNSHVYVKLENNGVDNYYFWISDEEIGDKTLQQHIFQYFYKRNENNISFNDICSDYDYGQSGNFIPIVGFSFIKRLARNETFYILILTPSDYDFYKNRFIIVPESEMIKSSIYVEEPFLYKADCMQL